VRIGGHGNLTPDFEIQLDWTDYFDYADAACGYVYANLEACICETF
jgi:hypothetical protein